MTEAVHVIRCDSCGIYPIQGNCFVKTPHWQSYVDPSNGTTVYLDPDTEQVTSDKPDEFCQGCFDQLSESQKGNLQHLPMTQPPDYFVSHVRRLALRLLLVIDAAGCH